MSQSFPSLDLEVFRKYNHAAIFAYVNKDERKVWISRTKSMSKTIVKYMAMKPETHPIGKECSSFITNPSSWELLILEDKGVNEDTGFDFIYKHQSLYKEHGYEILKSVVRYRIIGRIEKDYRPEFSNKFLYYVWLCSPRHKIRPLGVFANGKEGDVFFKEMRLTTNLYTYDNDLTKNYLEVWKDLEYDTMFKRKI